MSNRFSNIIKGSERINGVELYIDKNGTWNFIIVELSQTAGEIDVIKEHSAQEKQAFFNSIDKSFPIVLFINGKGVLNKKIDEQVAQLNPTKMLNHVLPNADKDSFIVGKENYIETEIISVIRKDILDEVLQSIQKTNIRLLDIYVGLGVLHILHQVASLDKIQTAGNVVTFNQGKIEHFDAHESHVKAYTIGGASRSSDSSGAIAAVFNYWINRKSEEESETDYVNFSRKEEKNKGVFQKVGMVLLVFLFAVVLVNFLVFQHYNKKESELKQKSSIYTVALEESKKISDEIQIKKALLNSVGGAASRAKFAFYSDQIAATVPDQLFLQALNFQPLMKAIKPKKKLDFNANHIEIEGQTINSGALNSWMGVMRELEFIEEVELMSFVQEGRKKGWFKLNIKTL